MRGAKRSAGLSSNPSRETKPVHGHLVSQYRKIERRPPNRIAAHRRRPTGGRRQVSMDRPSSRLRSRNNSDLRKSIRPRGRRRHSNRPSDRHSSQLLDHRNQVRDRHSSQLLDHRNQVRDRHSSQWPDRMPPSSRTNHGLIFHCPGRECHFALWPILLS